MLKTIVKQILPADAAAYEGCIRRFDAIAKPVGSLGALEETLARIAAITGSADINIGKKCVLVFCADNGIVRHGVAQSDQTVTTAIARMIANGTSGVCTMAKAACADVFPVDIGMCDTVAGMLPRKVLCGTADMTQGAAMSRDEALQAIQTGIELVKEKKEAGYQLIATGEAGIGNTTTSAAMASVLLGRSIEMVTGRGAGLSDEGLARKKAAIQKAIEVNRPAADDPIDVLAKLGGLDIAAMAGAFIGGALYHVPIVMDGVISAVAALTAVRICPAVLDFIIPSHISSEPAGEYLMETLGFTPMIHAGMRLGEGTGAVALFPLLDLAAAVYNNCATFADIAVDAYTRNT